MTLEFHLTFDMSGPKLGLLTDFEYNQIEIFNGGGILEPLLPQKFLYLCHCKRFMCVQGTEVFVSVTVRDSCMCMPKKYLYHLFYRQNTRSRLTRPWRMSKSFVYIVGKLPRVNGFCSITMGMVSHGPQQMGRYGYSTRSENHAVLCCSQEPKEAIDLF